MILNSLASVQAGNKMYIATGDSNEIIIVDLASNRVIGSIGELENAHGLAGHPSSDFLVAGSMHTGKKDQPGKPASVSEDEHKAHHAAGASASHAAQTSALSIVHPVHGHVMRRITVEGLTHHTAVSADGKHAAAVHSFLGKVSIVNLDTFTLVKTVKIGDMPNYAVFNATGSRLYISNAASGTVSVIDTQNWTKTADIKVGKGPEHMAINKNGDQLYVLNVIEGSVSVINTANQESVDKIKVGKSPHGIALNEAKSSLYVSNKGDHSVTSVNLKSGQSRTVKISPAPYHLEYIPSTDKIYLSSREKPLIWVLNPDSLEVVQEIEFKQGVAHQMVVMD